MSSSAEPLPEHASVIVIGGGVMGCSTLYHLAKSGVSDAVLLERNKLTSGTTWHSAAQVRALRSTKNLTDLIRYSIELYAALEEETGQATGWINKGSLSIATQPDRLTHILRQEALAKLYGVEAQAISTEEAKDYWPLMNTDDVIGAVWSPGDGRVSPSDLCAALIKGARRRDAKIFEDTGVTGILTKAGRVIGVETSGGTIRCDAVALCTGLWSRKAALMAGVEIPVWPCEHFYLLTKPIEGITGNMPTLSDHDSHLYIRDDSGGLLVGCFEPMGKSIDPDVLGESFAFGLLPEDWDHFEPMMVNALHRLPALETAEVKMLLNGPESFTPDGSFLLGEAAETRGLFLGCGMNSVGVATGGGAGMALAHCIQNGHPPIDLHEADPKRFSDAFNSVEALSARAPEVLGKHYEITYPGRQWSTARHLRALPLAERWKNEGAFFGQFYGWERPLYFGSDTAPELSFARPAWHEAVRREVALAHEGAAIFDQSSFGKIEVKGPDACSFLNRVCTNQMDRAVGQVIYTCMLNERGGVESDLTAIRLAEDHYRLSVGTTAIKRDLAWLRRHLRTADSVTLDDVSADFAVLSLMGPDAAGIAQAVDASALNDIRYFRAAPVEIAGINAHAARLSYVAEGEWEITCRADHAIELYDVLRRAGARPAGLFAQTAMRIEKKFLAFGHELDTDLSPLQTGLGFAVAWETDFIGKPALLKQKEQDTQNRIVTILLDDKEAVPIGSEPVIWNGATVGKTTSAAYGFRVDTPIALADLTEDAARQEGARVHISIADEEVTGRIVLGPAFDPSGSRMKRR